MKRIVCLLIFLSSINCSYLYSQEKNPVEFKSYDWGTIQYDKATSKIKVEIIGNISYKKNIVGVDANKKEIVTSDSIDILPVPQTLYFAIPPDAELKIEQTIITNSRISEKVPYSVKKYMQSDDSLGLNEVYSQIQFDELSQTSQPVTIEGYEWFRGYRLARLKILPYQYVAGRIEYLQKLETKIKLSKINKPMSYRKSTSDPQFDEIISKMVINNDDLQRISKTNITWNDTTGLWIPANKQSIKFKVDKDGIYRIKFEDINQFVNASSIDPTTFQIFYYGKEIPVYVYGEKDNMFSSGEYIEFPAKINYSTKNHRSIPTTYEEYPEYMNRYSDTSTYWLNWGAVAGLRLDTIAIIENATDTLLWHTEFVRVERNLLLQFPDRNDLVIRQDPRWTSGDVWGWNWLGAPGTFNVIFQANNIYTAYPNAKIYVRGSSWTWPSTTPAYKLRLRINTSDTLQWLDDTGASQHFVMQADVPINMLRNGADTIRLHSLRTASTTNAILTDWGEAEYPRKLVALNNSLNFSFPWISGKSIRVVRISGFTSPNIIIYKIKNSYKKISNIQVIGSGSYEVLFTDTIQTNDTYYVCTEENYLAGKNLALINFEDLRSTNNAADYIVITHKPLLSRVSSYASFIAEKNNFRYKVVDVENIFNEFGYGYSTPESIREFLKASTNWQSPMPSYVLLVGDASYDPKGYIANPDPSRNPLNTVPSLGQPVSDPMLTALDDASIIPQMYIGRITANTLVEFERYYTAAQNYYSMRKDDWNKKFILFAGGGNSSEIAQFKAVNDEIINKYIVSAPIGGMAANFYKTITPQTNFGPYTQEYVNNTIDNGAVFINYVGHSGTVTWDNGIIDPILLKNKRGRHPLISDFGCSTGKYGEPNISSFSEMFTIGENSSAIAYVGNSSLGFVSNATTLPQLFYKQFLQNEIHQIGRAHLVAKIERLMNNNTTTTRIMLLTNVLIGDPAIELDLPKQPNLSIKSENITSLPILPNEEMNQVSLVIPYQNTGLVTKDSFAIKITHQYEGISRDTTFYRQLPLFQDTIVINIPIKKKPGLHSFTIRLNSTESLQELYLDDNVANFNVIVAVTSFKVLKPLNGYKQRVDHFTILSPLKRTDTSSIIQIEIDTTSSFTTSSIFTNSISNVVTKVPVSGLLDGKRYYWRTGYLNSQSDKKVSGTLVKSSIDRTYFNQNDSASFYVSRISDGRYHLETSSMLKGISPGIKETKWHVVSGGYPYALGLLEVNGVNLLPNSYARGHNVVIFDSTTLSLREVRVFDTYASIANVDSLRAYLERVPYGVFVVILVIDEGAQNLNTNTSIAIAARNAIKSIGSALIDQIKTWDSWAIIGRKGATRGSVPEILKPANSGLAIIDTSFIRAPFIATIESPEIGPAGKWYDANLTAYLPVSTSLTTKIIGITKNGYLDTIYTHLGAGTIDLTSIDANRYTKMKLFSILYQQNIDKIPMLQEWSIGFDPPAELTYKSVRIFPDSLLEGDTANILVDVFNAGKQTANNVKVVLSGANKLIIDSTTISSIPIDTSKNIVFSYSSLGKKGNNVLFISIDPDTNITEFYKDNNTYSLPIFVLNDTLKPSIDITFDGQRIYDYDYVLPNPKIQVKVFDKTPLAIIDTSDITFRIDDRRIWFSNPDIIYEKKTGVEKANIIYTPKLSGRKEAYRLFLEVKKSTNPDTPTQTRLLFMVDSVLNLKNVFNYPNPFKSETHFTFILTNYVDDITIKIYTITGRLIQEIKVPFQGTPYYQVFWNGRDRDGDEVANGIYFYKIIAKYNGEVKEVIQKLAKIR